MLAKGTKSVADKLYPAMGNNDAWARVMKLQVTNLHSVDGAIHQLRLLVTISLFTTGFSTIPGRFKEFLLCFTSDPCKNDAIFQMGWLKHSPNWWMFGCFLFWMDFSRAQGRHDGGWLPVSFSRMPL